MTGRLFEEGAYLDIKTSPQGACGEALLQSWGECASVGCFGYDARSDGPCPQYPHTHGHKDKRNICLMVCSYSESFPPV